MFSAPQVLQFTTLLLLHYASACSVPPSPAKSALSAAGTQLNITALTSCNGVSILQCWSINPPFTTLDSGCTDAIAASLGGVSGTANFIVQGPGSVGGYRNAPAPQWSWFVSGVGHITLPTSSDEAWIMGGKYGLVYADDVNTTGHDTTFPSGENTVILGLPTAGGIQPNHSVIHEGPCRWEDLVAI